MPDEDTPRNQPTVQRMKRDELLSPQEDRTSGEQEYLNVLRPRRFSEYVGQRRVVSNLSIALQAARQRGEPLDHLLFDGPPGLGKTTLAHIIAHEMDVQLTLTSGPALDKAGILVGLLTRMQRGDILFIDEIHRLPRVVEEFLYPAMEDYRVDIPIDRGPHARSVTFNLQQFTLIGATTRKGLLTAPLRERFGIQHHLEFYEVTDLETILKRSAHILEVPMEAEGGHEIARRSRGTPRIANRLLQRVRDFAQVKADGTITREVAREALHRLGVDELGLDELDRQFLRVIVEQYGGGPVGLNALAATLQEEQDTLTDVVEPYLLKGGLLLRTSRGRMATAKTCEHLALPLPAGLRGKTAEDFEQEELFGG
jgi:holliday junction DNA helicase RuvB